ncbi:short-chain dehydrogenase [Novosphingobium endophyticum]|uniref:Short-chain dehydrogenase n=1 Tax=Novosphingobium endophyticum TaxID=1955250 RepID=A0A916TQP7_9SPHN|nr:SDR family NAD(P)-dependent oxidoreductase [Novosphingobium endophyticum]GGB94672.1 short-chain dehydrogenase [Novosphingobium endophyticum]
MPRALITGASSGIGREFAEQLAKRGYDLVLVARREARLRELAVKLGRSGVDIEVLLADLGEATGLRRVRERIAEGGSCDLVVNNAGFAIRGMAPDIALDDIAAMLLVNVEAAVGVSVAAMKRMMQQGQGGIINVASGMVFMQMPDNAGYASSKNFVMAFTRHMQAEAAESGVYVQLLLPGVVATEMHQVAKVDLSGYPPEIVMQVEDLVASSLKAFDTGELVCIPSLAAPGLWDAYVAAEGALAVNVSRDSPAERYK